MAQELETALLGAVGAGPVESGEFATAHDVPHLQLVGLLKSLQASDMVTMEASRSPCCYVPVVAARGSECSDLYMQRSPGRMPQHMQNCRPVVPPPALPPSSSRAAASCLELPCLDYALRRRAQQRLCVHGGAAACPLPNPLLGSN